MTSARELHIRLIVRDVDAAVGLHLAAAELKQRALQARDPRVALICARAHDRILAVAAAYAHMQQLSLDRPVEMAQALPLLCGQLCASLDYPAPLLGLEGEADDEVFPVLAALSGDGVVGEIIEDSVQREAVGQGCTVSFSLERDKSGDWVIAAANADAPNGVDAVKEQPALVETVRAWLERRLVRAHAHPQPT